MGLFLWLWRVALTWEIRWSLYAARQRRCLTSCFKFLVAVRYDGDCFIWHSDWHGKRRVSFWQALSWYRHFFRHTAAPFELSTERIPQRGGVRFLVKWFFASRFFSWTVFEKYKVSIVKISCFSSKLWYVFIVKSFPHCIFILSTCTTNITLLVIIKLL